jgi:nucleoid-associated protein YgaU
MPASFPRCLLVWSAATSAAAALEAWLAPSAASPAPGFDGALARVCAAVGALAAAWLWGVTTAVTVEALLGSGRRAPGVPDSVRRALLAACGVAVVAGLAAPAGAATGRHDPPQTAASVAAAAIAGLPLPDRPHGPAHPAHREVVTVHPGDSLWQIADERLGAGDRWPEIYALNRAVVGADPDLIEPAQRLRLPVQPKENR